MAPRDWQATALAAAAVALTAAPLVYYQWQWSIKRAERQQALRLLRKVELISSEVAVRLMHLQSQVDDCVAHQQRGAGAGADDEAAASTLNSYYHFDSKGNKLKTKWDSYDVDAELERLDSEDAPETTADPASSAAPRTVKPVMSKMKLLAAVGGIEHEFEAVLAFLDDVRGDEQVKQQRKAIATAITTEQFARIDAIRSALSALE